MCILCKIIYISNIDIPQLAMVKVDQERVDDGAQCTTCLETFELDEDVAKLDCQVSFIPVYRIKDLG
jgi:hypothetical protein